jgi:hypothetical protein
VNRNWLVVWTLCSGGAALAQDSGLSVSVGARAWYTGWTTFSYFTNETGDVNLALTQVSATDKLVLVPLISVRYGDFVGSLSVFPSTQFSFAGGESGTRKEYEANIGYTVIPGLTLTLGYKKLSQSGSAGEYRPAGLVAGLSGNAPLGGAFSLYGTLGVGRLKTPAGDKIDFKADYRLTEVGLAYTLDAGQLVRRWTFTAGYRTQVMNSKKAFGTQDGRDTTQGLTVGAIATF